MVKPTRRRSNRRRYALTLPELEHSKAAVLNSLGSLQSRRSYKHAIEKFIRWYCSEPRLALNRAVVLRYRLHLENIPLAPSTINVRLAAIRRIAAGPYKAPDAAAAPPATRATAPGTGTPMASAKTIRQMTMYPWLTIKERRSFIGRVSRLARNSLTGR